MVEYIGWISATLLACCGIPQAYLSVKQGHSDGVSNMFLTMWGLGELFGVFYVIAINSAPLTFNYLLNILLIGIISKYKIWRRV